MQFNSLPDAPRPYGIRAGQDPRCRLGGMVASIYATGVQTGDSVGLMMLAGGADAGLPLLRHGASHAGLYVTEGVVELTAGGKTYAMVKGDYASIPAGTPYGLRRARMRNVAMLFLTGGESVTLPQALGDATGAEVYPQEPPPVRFDRVLARLGQLDTVPLGAPPGGAPTGPGA